MKPRWLPKHELGLYGERIAVGYLRSKGYRILDRNFRIRYGEIDCIAFDPSDDSIVFVEVKTRSGTAFGLPEDAVTPGKLREIIKTSEFYMASHGNAQTPMRIDVIAVCVGSDGKVRDIRHIRNVTV